MASKAKTRAKISGNGRNVVATIPVERLRALLPTLPAGEDRDALVIALEEADEAKAGREREARLATPLSIESLSPLGWMMTGAHSARAYGAIRHGDFRDEGDGEWAYGPTGAFDREPVGVRVMRGATQAGVMSEEHAVYRLLPPTADRQAAIADAMRLEAEWRGGLPRRRIKPIALQDGGVYGSEAKGMCHSDWLRYMRREDLAGLPEGARIAQTRQGARPSSHDWRVSDIVHDAGDAYATVAMFPCDAVLRPLLVATGSSLHGYTRTAEHRWAVGRRAFDPAFDTRRGRALSGPYDCVLGSVWSVSHNQPLTREQVNALQSTVYTGSSGGKDRRDNETFPLATRDEAERAALAFAIMIGAAKGVPPEMPEMPETIATPEIDDAVDLSIAA